MIKMSRIIAPALCAAMALGAAIPAQAAPAQSRSATVSRQIEQLQSTVERSDRRDRISEREAASLRHDIRKLEQQFRAYNRDGLSKWEYNTLERRIERIQARLHIEKHDRNSHRM